jgi:formylglycine-generating enzyme required for sulfatase activity
MRSVNLITVMFALMTGAAFAETFGSGSNQFNIDFVIITGDASSANGTDIGSEKTFTDPGYDYRIGKYEITNDQWDKFKAEYGPVDGSPFYAYDSSSSLPGPNLPTNKISWYEAAQFVNWLNTSKGYQAAYKFTGTQGTGDYTFTTWSELEAWQGVNLYRHKNAQYFLPSEDEWVKAAYWNGSTLQRYATKDASVAQAGVDSNYENDIYQPWDVGSGSEELNGTFDMMGNICEWAENPYRDETFGFDSERVYRGGFSDGSIIYLLSPVRLMGAPGGEWDYSGFRVASVAEPIECPSADLSGDCFVGIEDLSVLAQQWCSGLQNN